MGATMHIYVYSYTYKDVPACGRKRDRRAGVGLFDSFAEWELVAWLDLA
jgi:hypothetical protein